MNYFIISIFSFFLLALPAQSASLRSQNGNEIEQLIETSLRKINESARREGLGMELVFQYGDVDRIARKLSGHFGRKQIPCLLKIMLSNYFFTP